MKKFLPEIKGFLFLFFIFTIPAFFLTRSLQLRLDTDYDAHLPIYEYFTESLKKGHGVPTWNPYVGTGIPVFGDPQTGIYNPVMILPSLVLGVDAGMWISILFCFLFSGISMWFFLSVVAASRPLRFWAAALYMFASGLFSKVAAGQVEHFFSFVLLPLFYLALLRSSGRRKDGMLTGLILGLFLLFGDVYPVLYLSILFFVHTAVRFMRTRQFGQTVGYVGSTYLVFFVVILPKLVPFVFTVLPIFDRYYQVRPKAGSIHLLFSIIPYVVPFQTSFYDRPFFRNLFGFEFNWHEYYAFISPLPFLFLGKVQRVLATRMGTTLAGLIFTGFLYASLGYAYSPFYWIIKYVPFLGEFRAPQRMYVTLLPLVIGFLTLSAKKSFERPMSPSVSRVFTCLCVVSLAWVYATTLLSFTRAFEEKRTDEMHIAEYLRSVDKESFFVVTKSCCMQRFLMQQKIPLLNYYYGWRPKATPGFVNFDTERFDDTVFSSVRPRYIIAKEDQGDFSAYSYQRLYEYEDFIIWKTEKETIVSTL
ncbi:MAG: hypothetical protein Q7S76_02215 [bacterium]|nr:hypothetical protein [bacterium]